MIFKGFPEFLKPEYNPADLIRIGPCGDGGYAVPKKCSEGLA